MRISPILAALALAGVCAPAMSQTTDRGSAATSTGTTTTQQEMNRGVPGVDVDVGRNARGAVDVDVDRKTDTRNAPGARDTDPASTDPAMRPARADRG